MLNSFANLTVPVNWPLLIATLATALLALMALASSRKARSRDFIPGPTEFKRVDPKPLPAGYDPFEQGSANEKRRAWRHQGSGVDVLFDEEALPDQPSEGWVTDRSSGGLGLRVFVPVEVGTRLRIRPLRAPDTTVWIDIDVRSCRREEDGWQLHCAFHKKPPYSVQLLFD